MDDKRQPGDGRDEARDDSETAISGEPLMGYDKTLADSFPASDPPAQP
jgi:hypothetical protein